MSRNKLEKEINRHYWHLLIHRPQKEMVLKVPRISSYQIWAVLQGSSREDEYKTRYIPAELGIDVKTGDADLKNSSIKESQALQE